ncbi:MAG: cyclic nucleotide-binding/CBS domain-containing protein [Rhodospirillales bacterium]
MKRSIIPHVVNAQEMYTLGPDATAADCARQLMEWNVAAVCVLEDGSLAGIVTERDLARRVLASGANPQTTKLGDIMTRNPDVLGPGDSATDALKMMQKNRYRHMPVVDGGKVVGMVSIRDLYQVVMENLEEDMAQTEAYVLGHGYSA